jgi:hypothetical protein
MRGTMTEATKKAEKAPGFPDVLYVRRGNAVYRRSFDPVHKSMMFETRIDDAQGNIPEEAKGKVVNEQD